MKWSAGYSCSVSIKPTVVSPKEEYEAALQDSSCKGGCDRFVCEDLWPSRKLKRGVQNDRYFSVDPGHHTEKKSGPIQPIWGVAKSIQDDIPASVRICDEIGASGNIPVKLLGKFEWFPV